MESELFTVEVNEEGYNWIKRIIKIATIALVITFLASIVNITTTIPYIIRANQNNTFASRFRVNNILTIVFLLINLASQIVQVISYWWFAADAKKAIERKDTAILNKSFRWLLIQGICFLVPMTGSIVHLILSYLLS